MAREHANLRLDIWTDQAWRELSSQEQWLYMALLTHPSLSYAGVADWRPGRLAALAADPNRATVEAIGRALQAKRFILIDDETEEVLVRSFLRYDGLLKQPKVTVSMVNAYGATASQGIRKVIIHELRKLVDEGHEWAGLRHERVVGMLDQPSAPIDEFTPAFTPELTLDFTPGFTPSAGQDYGLHTATTTTTTTTTPSDEGGSGGKSSRKKPESQLPSDWSPTEEHQRKARQRGVDLTREAENFRLHAEANDRRMVNWNAAFTMWLNKAHPPHNRPQSAADRARQRGAERHQQIENGTLGGTASWDDIFQQQQIERRAG